MGWFGFCSGWSEGGRRRVPLLITITYADRWQRQQHDSARCPCAAGRPADGGAGRPSSAGHAGCACRSCEPSDARSAR